MFHGSNKISVISSTKIRMGFELDYTFRGAGGKAGMGEASSLHILFTARFSLFPLLTGQTKFIICSDPHGFVNGRSPSLIHAYFHASSASHLPLFTRRNEFSTHVLSMQNEN